MDVVGLLRELVARPSLNPGDTDNPAWVGEERVATFLDAHFLALGFRTSRHPFEQGRDNLLACAGAHDPERVLLIEGHMDTVAVDHMTIPPFDLAEREGRLFGRGACDTKGPCAAAISGFTPRVLKALATSNRAIHYLAACAEEVGCFGAVAAVEQGIGADEAIILEPTDLQPVIAHKGPLWFRIRVVGRACHGSQPERGLNAIDVAMQIAAFLRDMPFEVLDDPLLGPPTRNLGCFHGGHAANIVPDSCTLEYDFRVLPGEDQAAMHAKVRKELERLKFEARILDFTLECTECGAFKTDPSSALARRLISVSGADPIGTSWYSDAGPLAATCGDIAVFGPGSIHQAHTKDEYIERAELEKGAAMFETVYLDFLEEN